MAWRFNAAVVLTLSRADAHEIYDALNEYRDRCNADEEPCDGVDRVIAMMKAQTETRRATERP